MKPPLHHRREKSSPHSSRFRRMCPTGAGASSWARMRHRFSIGAYRPRRQRPSRPRRSRATGGTGAPAAGVETPASGRMHLLAAAAAAAAAAVAADRSVRPRCASPHTMRRAWRRAYATGASAGRSRGERDTGCVFNTVQYRSRGRQAVS